MQYEYQQFSEAFPEYLAEIVGRLEQENAGVFDLDMELLDAMVRTLSVRP